MATGVFDLLHVGHVRFLSEAKALGDELVVVVATDETVRQRKHEPIMPEHLRCEVVSALRSVDRAIIGRNDDHLRTVEEVRPDVIVLGYDQDVDETELVSALSERGLHVRVVRLGRHEDDLNGTRQIIRKVVDWYALQRRLREVEEASRM